MWMCGSMYFIGANSCVRCYQYTRCDEEWAGVEPRHDAQPEGPMKFMVIVKASANSEAGVMPDEKLLTAMGKYNEELVKAGVMLAGEGLHPTSKGARVKFSGDKRTVIDGPFNDP